MTHVSYDERADVLYVRYSDVSAFKAMENPAGFVRRYSKDGDLVGVTILDFTHRLLGSNERLIQEITSAPT